MYSRLKKNVLVFILGDIITLYISLFLTLLIRYFVVPTIGMVYEHMIPFSILFLFWIITFFIFGMYEQQNFIDKKKIIPIVVQSQILNTIIAIIFFYFSSLTSITPKTNLFIYIVISITLLIFWRIFGIIFISKKTIPICIIAQGEDALFIKKDLEQNKRGFELVHFVDISRSHEEIISSVEFLKNKKIEYIVIDSKDASVAPFLSYLYEYVFSHVEFFEMNDLYERLYNRAPLQNITHIWFIEHIKSRPHVLYDMFKRTMDICIAFCLFIFSLLVYPCVFICIKLEDRGPLFYRDIRIGLGGKIITILKFRSMSVRIVPEIGKKVETRTGRFLRKTRIDELPQLINVLRGDLSLIGPRPEQPKLVESYIHSIPFYDIRHLITPGLSGWAQIYHDNHPHHDLDISATKEKLSYDLFYLKNRSIILDIIISLKTIKTMLLSKGK